MQRVVLSIQVVELIMLNQMLSLLKRVGRLPMQNKTKPLRMILTKIIKIKKMAQIKI